MIGRRRPATPASNPWHEEGRRLASQLSGLSAAVVTGRDADAAARLALEVARAVASERRVAIADLVGAAEVFAPIGGVREGTGLTDSFVRGLSLNEVAKPAEDGTPGLFFLPHGLEPLSPDVLANERWRRLVVGFAEAGALLLIVARIDQPGLDRLVPSTDGVLAVGDADIPIAWRVLAQASAPASPGPSPASRSPRRRTRHLAWLAVGATVLGGAVALWRPWLPGRGPEAATTLPTASNAPRPGAVAGVAASQAGKRAAAPARSGDSPADTVRVLDPVNPPDSAVAAQFAVELVATNTAAGANLWVRERGGRLPGLTVTPVVLGASSARWHRVNAGAFRERAGADSLLRALRDNGVLRHNAGVVVRRPMALLLESDVSRAAAVARLAALVARGAPAYALLQDDGTVRLYAGAFETPAAAVSLDADLRGAGLHPALAYRTGRTF
ncbi:MAG: hypothetical protein FJ363_05905 [Gemmatimonadetes bacterium]|nr:hypothetical protein [Gemmatimonadota bacterium]